MIEWWGASGHPQHVPELVLERAGEVVVDRVERQRERLAVAGRAGRPATPRGARSPRSARAASRPAPAPGRAGGHGQVQRLEHERRDPPRPLAAVVRGVGQQQLVPGPGHAHVEQPALLLELVVALGQGLVDELERQGERLAPARRREPPGHEARQVHDGELEALRLVDGHHGDRVRVGVDVGRRRIVAGLDQGLEVAGEEHGPVVGEERRLGAHDVEEARDVGQRLLGRDGLRLGQALAASPSRAGRRTGPRPPAARGRARCTSGGPRRACAAPARVSAERRRIPGWRPSSSRISKTLRLRRRAMFTMPTRSAPPSPYSSDAASAVHVHGGARVRDGAQERQQEPHLRAGVEAAGARRSATGRPPG